MRLPNQSEPIFRVFSAGSLYARVLLSHRRPFSIRQMSIFNPDFLPQLSLAANLDPVSSSCGECVCDVGQCCHHNAGGDCACYTCEPVFAAPMPPTTA